MLETLRIANFGAVDELVLELEPGLTVLTGETGVGKTLLVEALHLVLGGNDRGLPVRDPSRPSRVEALFTVDGSELVLVRERSSGGRLRATVDGSLSSAPALAERAESLCELHGQHEHQVLRAPGAARALLDRAAGIDDAPLRDLHARRRDALEARDRLGGSHEERARRVELVAHEIDEIDAVAPAGADELDRRLEEAVSVSSILDSKDALRRAAIVLDDDGDAPTAAGLLESALVEVPRELGKRREELEGLLLSVRALSQSLHEDLDLIDEDPERLGVLSDRIERLQALVRKHGHTLGDVLARRDALVEERERLAADEARSKDLDRELSDLDDAVTAESAELRAARTTASAALADAVQGRLAPLALPHARFEVAVDGVAGEHVQFLFAGSSAFEPAPLADTASGGELSRVMLALTLATQAAVPCVVFDEVDAGVGGATARSLASCLAELAQERQVLVVTHLATIAAAAAHHFVVTRSETADGAATVTALDPPGRVAEIARMLAGDPADPVAIAHAEALLDGDTAVA